MYPRVSQIAPRAPTVLLASPRPLPAGRRSGAARHAGPVPATRQAVDQGQRHRKDQVPQALRGDLPGNAHAEASNGQAESRRLGDVLDQVGEEQKGVQGQACLTALNVSAYWSVIGLSRPTDAGRRQRRPGPPGTR